MQNIDLFNDYTAAILSKLYSQFPVKNGIDARQLCGHSDVNDFGLVLDERGQPSKAFEIAVSTMEWLTDYGYVSYANRTSYAFSQAVLTAKGLEHLRRSSDALKSKETLGERLTRFVSDGSKEFARETVKTLLSMGVDAVRSAAMGG